MTDLNERDVRVDTYSNSAGAVVKVTHILTGLTAESDRHASAYRAREEALLRLAVKRGVQPAADDGLRLRFDELRTWLRSHGDYNVTLSPWSLYGTYRITVTHLDREVFTDIGDTLDKRLDKAMAFLREVAP